MSRIIQQSTLSMIVVVIVIISAAIETDVFVPSFPAIKEYFDISESLTQMILSMNFLGLCVSALFYGPLSDAYGRRRVLLIGMAIFLIASIGCVLAQSIESLLFWRFVQGLGSSAAFVVPGAVIFDLFSQAKAARIMAFYNSVITIVMAGAPIVGSYLHIAFGWRANFVFILLFSIAAFLLVLLLLKETLTAEQRQPIDVREILKGYVKLLTNRRSVLSMTIICVAISSYLTYIANLSLVFVDYMGVDEATYGWYQSALLIVFAAMSLSMGFWMRHFSIAKLKFVGQTLCLLGASALLTISLLIPQSPLFITMAMCLHSAGFALLIAIVFSDYMSVYPEMKGSASALITAMRLVITAVAISVVSLFFDGTMLPIAIFVVILTVISWLAFMLDQLD